MIRNDEELEVAQARIATFQKWLKDMRATTSVKELATMSSRYRLEIERMQAEVMDYLLLPTFVDPQTTQVA